jgi:hypothetical protein
VPSPQPLRLHSSPPPPSTSSTPAPDCAAENCQGLRIIDGNAEAYRIDAMRRAGS